MQATIANTELSQPHSNVNNLYCFLGGFLIHIALDANQLPIHLNKIVEYLTSADFAIFLLESFVGGFIALFFKVITESVLNAIKNSKGKGGKKP